MFGALVVQINYKETWTSREPDIPVGRDYYESKFSFIHVLLPGWSCRYRRTPACAVEQPSERSVAYCFWASWKDESYIFAIRKV